MDVRAGNNRAASHDPWRAARWRRQGYDRLYVHADSGISIGWYDLDTGDLHAVEPSFIEPLTAFVRHWLDSEEARAIGPLPPPHAPATHVVVQPRRGRRPAGRPRGGDA
nr:hypothetical protein [Propionibacterium sp.]